MIDYIFIILSIIKRITSISFAKKNRDKANNEILSSIAFENLQNVNRDNVSMMYFLGTFSHSKESRTMINDCVNNRKFYMLNFIYSYAVDINDKGGLIDILDSTLAFLIESNTEYYLLLVYRGTMNERQDVKVEPSLYNLKGFNKYTIVDPVKIYVHKN